MKTRLSVFTAVFAALASCDTPSREFSEASVQTVQVGQSVFDVRQIGTQVELIRTNSEFAPTFASIIPRAAEAVVLATGCAPRPETWEGEQTIMQVSVDC